MLSRRPNALDGRKPKKSSTLHDPAEESIFLDTRDEKRRGLSAVAATLPAQHRSWVSSVLRSRVCCGHSHVSVHSGGGKWLSVGAWNSLCCAKRTCVFFPVYVCPLFTFRTLYRAVYKTILRSVVRTRFQCCQGTVQLRGHFGCVTGELRRLAHYSCLGFERNVRWDVDLRRNSPLIICNALPAWLEWASSQQL